MSKPQWVFRAWLRLQRKRDDSVGDFARDWLADEEAKGIRTFSAMDRHLNDLNVDEKVWAARERAAREFLMNDPRIRQ